jgi:hypothetical protein
MGTDENEQREEKRVFEARLFFVSIRGFSAHKGG